jgi:hypothetical protein
MKDVKKDKIVKGIGAGGVITNAGSAGEEDTEISIKRTITGNAANLPGD